MVYYGISLTKILATIAIILAVLYLVLLIVAEVLERNRATTDVQTIVDSLERCSSGDKDKCEKCEYRHRGTPNGTCIDMLLHDSECLINDQQELIAKFGKKLMKE